MEAVVAIAVALIAAAAGFAGGYFGSRWQAETALAQWRRDKLLQFCGDYLAAQKKLIDASWSRVDDADVEFPEETSNLMLQAHSSIRLLSTELEQFASACTKNTFAAWNAVAHGQGNIGMALDLAGSAMGQFVAEAHVELMKRQPIPTLWTRFRSRLAAWVPPRTTDDGAPARTPVVGPPGNTEEPRSHTPVDK